MDDAYPVITSAANPAIRHVVRLRDRRDREREQLTVLEGYRELTRGREYGLAITEAFFAPEWFLGENEMPLLSAALDWENTPLSARPKKLIGEFAALMIDLTDCPEAKEGDVAVIYGDGSGNTMSIPEAASLAGTNKNEIIARILSRPPRVYVK